MTETKIKTLPLPTNLGAAERLAAAPATEPSEVERLAMEIADVSAKALIFSECLSPDNSVPSWDGWWDTSELDPLHLDTDVHYLDLRGPLEHHPDHPEWVRVKEKRP